MYQPVRVEAPAISPVSLAEATAHLRSEVDDNTLVEALIDAATSHLDGWTGVLGRCLVEQTWRQDFDDFARCLRLPLAPVISIASVVYDDEDGDEQTVASASYQLVTDARGSYVRFDDDYDFPAVDDEGPSVRVTYVAGYSNEDSPATSAVPAALKQAILLLVGHWYANRESVVVGVTPAAVPMAVDALVAPFRRSTA